MEDENKTVLEHIESQIKGSGVEMALSKFVELNLESFQRLKEYHVPLKKQAQIASLATKKSVSVSSLAVALSRLQAPSKHALQEKSVITKTINKRFVDKSAKLILGTQKEEVKIIKNGIAKTEQRVIDWRGLAPEENVASWILEYKGRLAGINATGWRWAQITQAINEHLNLKKQISVNTLTSIISISNKKDKALSKQKLSDNSND